MNLIIAAFALVGGLILLPRRVVGTRPKLDLPETLAVSTSLFSIVYGFSSAQTNGWNDGVTLSWLAAGVALLITFVLIETRVSHPLLPLRVIWDRNRGGSYVALLVAGAGMFAIFLFLTFFLQASLRFTPIQTGLAFLPMIGTLAVTAAIAASIALPRVGPRPLIPVGMVFAASGLVFLTRISLDSSYTGHILPGLLIMGVGLGLVIAPAMQGAVSGVSTADVGVASATVSTMQQVGGSIGTALLSTIAANAATNYLVAKAPSALVAAQAAVASYAAAFWWAAGLFAVGAVITAVLLRSGPLETAAEE